MAARCRRRARLVYLCLSPTFSPRVATGTLPKRTHVFPFFLLPSLATTFLRSESNRTKNGFSSFAEVEAKLDANHVHDIVNSRRRRRGGKKNPKKAPRGDNPLSEKEIFKDRIKILLLYRRRQAAIIPEIGSNISG